MKRLSINQKYDNSLVIALGFFDCIHKGHAELLMKARTLSQGSECAIFTFDNDPYIILGGEKQIYTIAEREEAVHNLGIDTMICAAFDQDFASLEAEQFLNLLSENFNIKGVVIGEDYRFGKGAAGDINLLRKHFESLGAFVHVVPFEMSNSEKISTSKLKHLVSTGDISPLNSQLSEPYFMLGQVKRERGVGKKIGYPTANISINEGKLQLANGIYATRIYFDGQWRDSMTNVGAKPTFNISSPSIETYIFDFDGDIYGREVKLSFFERTRDIKAFESAIELKAQLASDEKQIKDILSNLK